MTKTNDIKDKILEKSDWVVIAICLLLASVIFVMDLLLSRRGNK